MKGDMTEDASRALRDAYKQGVIDTVIPRFDAMDERILKYVRQERLFHPPSKKPGWQQPWQNPKAQRYYEHFFEYADQDILEPEWLIELARFPVPYGSIGIVKQFDQFAKHGNTRITQYAYWGFPLITVPPRKVIYHFRLSPFDGRQPARHSANNNVLPGVPYTDHPNQRYVLQPIHASGNDVHWIIPGGQMLRVFFWTPAANERWIDVWARVRGYLQSGYSKEAAHNARSGW